FEIAGCWIVPAQTETGVYVVFRLESAKDISDYQLHAFFIYVTGEQVETWIAPYVDGQSHEKKYKVNPLLSGQYASFGLCPRAVLITASGDLIEATRPLEFFIQ